MKIKVPPSSRTRPVRLAFSERVQRSAAELSGLESKGEMHLVPEEQVSIRLVLADEVTPAIPRVAKLLAGMAEDVAVAIAGNGVSVVESGCFGTNKLVLAVTHEFIFQHSVSPSEDCFLYS